MSTCNGGCPRKYVCLCGPSLVARLYRFWNQLWEGTR